MGKYANLSSEIFAREHPVKIRPNFKKRTIKIGDVFSNPLYKTCLNLRTIEVFLSRLSLFCSIEKRIASRLTFIVFEQTTSEFQVHYPIHTRQSSFRK